MATTPSSDPTLSSARIVIEDIAEEPNMGIKVYSKPSCVQCTATYRALDKWGLDYEVVDLSQDEASLLELMARGYQQAPVVEADGEYWTGFRPDLIKAVAGRAA